MRLLHGPLPSDPDPALDLALAHAVLRRVSRGEADATLRVYRPGRPAVAFGRRDLHRPGFPDAVAACRTAGFACVVRPSGGRAVAHTTDALVIDHVSPDPQSPAGMEERFEVFGDLFAGVLAGFGIDARVGEVPGEYCPGAHSVNARGVVKLVGTAQRMVRNAWLFSSVLVFDGARVMRPLLAQVYDALDLSFDPSSVGSVRAELHASGAAPTDLDTVQAAVLDAYAGRFDLEPTPLDEDTLAEAGSMVGEHRVSLGS